MPRKYIKKPPKCQDARVIKKAAKLVIKKKLSPLEAARKYNLTQVSIRKCMRALRGRRKRTHYSQADLEAAIRDLQEKKAPLGKVSKRYGIPRSTLSCKLQSPCPLAKKSTGKGPVLVREEEEAIKTWILERTANEELLSWNTIATTLQMLLNEQGLKIFKNNNKPTSGWLQAFMRRHPELRKVRLGPWTTGIVAGPTTGDQDEEEECEG
ncbi:uncharacterized protein LOC125039137 [Penaeus chinensis]|uniref:uncharacterized protein LOC125039137 n=1 Tax=Penaeus chinensis TaxID=139456 RepID=UPI001FB625EB|nr:uncharacterized protein LOC125039137 [Penaeus chinensis]